MCYCFLVFSRIDIGTFTDCKSATSGAPGKISITEDASITALMHEQKHFLDDLEMGFLGWEKTVYTPKVRWQMEYDAYMV